MSREKILNALKANQPALVPLPADLFNNSGNSSAASDNNAGNNTESSKNEGGNKKNVSTTSNLVQKFKATAETIGSKVYLITDEDEIPVRLAADFQGTARILTTIDTLTSPAIHAFEYNTDPHTYADVDAAIFKADLAVAENSAIWITEQQAGTRVLPFITQHIIILVSASLIVSNLHEAYQLLQNQDYNYGTFIAGPSKTADIEQSLVLGAHGPRSMTIFICS